MNLELFQVTVSPGAEPLPSTLSSEEFQMKVGDNIKLARQKMKLDQRELGVRLADSGVTTKSIAQQPYISRIESGRINMTLKTLLDFAKILRTTPAQLVS